MAIDKSTMIGSPNSKVISAYLERIGDTKAASEFYHQGAVGRPCPFHFSCTSWGQTGAKIGFIPEGRGSGDCEIIDAIGMDADEALKEAALKVSLDAFYLHNYPGLGKHRILCEFTGRARPGFRRNAVRA